MPNTRKVLDKAIRAMDADARKVNDESYIVRGKKYKVLSRNGNNVKVMREDGYVSHMDIDFLMENGKKIS